MANLNRVFLMGNLTRDPELRYTQGGTAIAKFGMAINRNWTSPEGEKKEDVCFVDITAFGNRVNSFGAVHNCNARWTWHGPSAWRTRGEDWSYEYQLKPTGIQVAPLVEHE